MFRPVSVSAFAGLYPLTTDQEIDGGSGFFERFAGTQ
jgi:hypothetical protein